MSEAEPSIGQQDAEPLRAEVTLQDVASFKFLKKVWAQRIRGELRRATLNDFYLAQDPVQFAAYEWQLDSFISRLVQDLRTGTYSPDPADILRGAKSKGLSRPLAFLSPRDILVYVAIIEKAAIDLRRDLRPWTGASRAEKNKSAGEANDGYEDFFQIWLQRQGIVSNICQRFEYVVESDVSNFFGSIDPGVLQEFLQGSTSLHRDVVRLCVHLIRRTLRHPEYAESPALGLPQEGFGASRAIGHALLCEVDREFDHEGADGIYGRFMDDFVTGADEVFEAEILISRLQHRLERLGLYPNSAKTKIVRVSEFLRQSMASENVFLDEVDSVLKECETGTLRQIIDFPDECLDSLLERANAFRGISPINRPERYDRLLRRYYTLFRRLGRDDWLPHAIEDVSVFPALRV